MPIKNQGSVPRGKGERDQSKKQAKKDERDLKQIVAEATDNDPAANDPRRTGR